MIDRRRIKRFRSYGRVYNTTSSYFTNVEANDWRRGHSCACIEFRLGADLNPSKSKMLDTIRAGLDKLRILGAI